MSRVILIESSQTDTNDSVAGQEEPRDGQEEPGRSGGARTGQETSGRARGQQDGLGTVRLAWGVR